MTRGDGNGDVRRHFEVFYGILSWFCSVWGVNSAVWAGKIGVIISINITRYSKLNTRYNKCL